MRFPRLWLLALSLAFATNVHAAETAMRWPTSELASHVQAWFAQLRGSEADARSFFTSNMAPGPVTIEERLQRRRGMLERTGALTPVGVVGLEEASMQVRARTAEGEDVLVIVEAEPTSPHRILGIRLEAGGPGDGGPRREVSAGPPLSDNEAITQITQHLDARAQAETFAGAVLFARAGKPLMVRAWGEADRAEKVPNTATTRFNLASIGKMFTLVALAQLAEAKKLSLDDPLAKYLPDFPRAKDITLAMLAEHRSGVGDFFNDNYEKADRSKLRHNRDYLALLHNQPLWFEPGTQARYSNGGFVLLGEVIAKASGMDYYDYLQERVFKVAGMKSTGFPIEGSKAAGIARGYTREGAANGRAVDNASTRPARGSAAGGSYSTVADMLAFDQALLGTRLAGGGWSEWVIGGPRPDRASGAAGRETPSFGFAGGAPGISSEWLREGDCTLIVLTNLDPEVARSSIEPLRDIMRRVGPPAR